MKIISALYTGHAGLGTPDFVVASAKEFVQILDDRPPGEDTELYVLVLHGGTDIHPGLYGQKAHYTNQQQGNQPSARDAVELMLFELARKYDIPVFGICRGAQLGCVVSGGSLYQDFRVFDSTKGQGEVYNTKYGHTVTGNSYHHQLMDLAPLKEGEDYELIAWTEYKQYRTDRDDVKHESGTEENDPLARQPEIVWFPKTKCFAVQGHPEWAVNSPFQHFCIDEFTKRINDV